MEQQEDVINEMNQEYKKILTQEEYNKLMNVT